MRCRECNRPFTPTQYVKAGKVYFEHTCYHCNSKYFKGYANSHEHVMGVDEEPLVKIAKEGSIRTQV